MNKDSYFPEAILFLLLFPSLPVQFRLISEVFAPLLMFVPTITWQSVCLPTSLHAM